MTDEELYKIYLEAGKSCPTVDIGPCNLCGLRAVYNAALTRAARIARKQAVNWAMTYKQFAADNIAAAIDAEREKK